MGFNYFGYGAVMPCEVIDHKIKVTLPSGFVREFETSLNVNIPEQTRLFKGPRVWFSLEHEGFEYVGRPDGSIGIYRMSDDLYYGASTWQPPFGAYVMECGYCNLEIGRETIYFDTVDGKSIYTMGSRASAVLDEAKSASTKWDLVGALRMSALADSYGTYVVQEDGIGGKRLATSKWLLQAGLRSPDCPYYF